MQVFLNRFRRRVLLTPPEDPVVLTRCLEAFTAGFNRGIDDVCRSVAEDEWRPLVHRISRQLVFDRSALEAGCWLAGVHRGRDDERRHIVPLQSIQFEYHLRRRFCDDWESSAIADCTLESSPSPVGMRQLLKVMFVGCPRDRIADRLPKNTPVRGQAV